MEPEYFFRESVRWNFGFANPNKAAVLFACLLPLAWAAWAASWRLKRGLRVMALFGSGIGVLGAGFCLLMTYSRGGILAGGVALAFLWLTPWRDLPRKISAVPRSQKIISGWLVATLLGMFAWLGAAGRSVEAISNDASVGNRLVLWQKALVMAVENPQGFGAGHSGAAYMQWYQSASLTAGYRTMVNSYLTFLVEQGWLAFLGLVFGFLVFWLWVSGEGLGRAIDDWRRAALGVWVAFLVAAIFSTTMEHPALWILPILSAGLLAFLAWRGRGALAVGQMGVAAGLTLFLGVGLWISGNLLARKEPMRRAFAWSAMQSVGDDLRSRGDVAPVLNHGDLGNLAVELVPRGARGQTSWLVIPDTEVLGACYGKLLRTLSDSTGVRLVVASDPNGVFPDRILAGRAVRLAGTVRARRQILLAPSAIDAPEALAVLQAAERTILVVPDIDEDGRVAFWREKVRGNAAVEVVTLEGVGTQVDWAWDLIVSLLTREFG